MKYFIVLAALATLAQGKINWSEVKGIRPVVVPPPTRFFPRAPEDRNRVVGGTEVQKNSIPYQVAIFIHAVDGTFFCGGTLISRKYVLTAAHCAIIAQEVTVILGAHNMRIEEETQVRINSTKFKIFEDYDQYEKIGDIALIELPEAVKLTPEIGLVQLPSYSEAAQNYTGANATVSGWGKDHDEAPGTVDLLRSTWSDIITNYDCNQYYFGMIQDSHVCLSGKGGKSACNGDSGGPLMVKNIQIGIVAFGISFGCEIEWPGAYTRTSSYLQWIEKNSDVIIGK